MDKRKLGILADTKILALVTTIIFYFLYSVFKSWSSYGLSASTRSFPRLRYAIIRSLRPISLRGLLRGAILSGIGEPATREYLEGTGTVSFDKYNK